MKKIHVVCVAIFFAFKITFLCAAQHGQDISDKKYRLLPFLYPLQWDVNPWESKKAFYDYALNLRAFARALGQTANAILGDLEPDLLVPFFFKTYKESFINIFGWDGSRVDVTAGNNRYIAFMNHSRKVMRFLYFSHFPSLSKKKGTGKKQAVLSKEGKGYYFYIRKLCAFMRMYLLVASQELVAFRMKKQRYALKPDHVYYLHKEMCGILDEKVSNISLGENQNVFVSKQSMLAQVAFVLKVALFIESIVQSSLQKNPFMADGNTCNLLEARKENFFLNTAQEIFKDHAISSFGAFNNVKHMCAWFSKVYKQRRAHNSVESVIKSQIKRNYAFWGEPLEQYTSGIYHQKSLMLHVLLKRICNEWYLFDGFVTQKNWFDCSR